MASTVFALNLLDLTDHDDYRGYLRISAPLVVPHGGEVISIAEVHKNHGQKGGYPRSVMVLVAWESAAAFASFKSDRSAEHAHRLRELGGRNYLWWSYDALEDPHGMLGDHGDEVAMQN